MVVVQDHRPDHRQDHCQDHHQDHRQDHRQGSLRMRKYVLKSLYV